MRCGVYCRATLVSNFQIRIQIYFGNVFDSAEEVGSGMPRFEEEEGQRSRDARKAIGEPFMLVCLHVLSHSLPFRL